MSDSYKSNKYYKYLDVFELRLLSKYFHCTHCIMGVGHAKKRSPILINGVVT